MNFVTDKFCSWFYDEKTCWPYAKANTNVSLPCPKEQGFNKMSNEHIIFDIIAYFLLCMILKLYY